MSSLLLYLGMMALGVWIGSKTLDRKKEYPWIGRLQMVMLLFLITALGVEIGSDQQVISSLSEIGFSAFLLTVFSGAGSLLFVYLVRKWLRLDRQGRPAGEAAADSLTNASEEEGTSHD